MSNTQWQLDFLEFMQGLVEKANELESLMSEYPRADGKPPDVKQMRKDLREVLAEYEGREGGLALRRLAELLRLLPSFDRRANGLDGKKWMLNSISIWSDITKNKQERKLEHPAMFPSELARRLIDCFTNDQARVILDPFLGVGSTIVAAKELGKDAIGIEISPEYAEKARSRVNFGVSQLALFEDYVPDINIHVADSRDLCQYVAFDSVDMVITSPPYWDILLEKRTVDNKESRAYGETRQDLGKIRDYEEFLLELRKVFEQVFAVVKPKSYCCVIVMDLRKKDRFYPLHMDISKFMADIGFILDDIIIWNRGQEYNNLRPLGYPSVFRVNRIHEFILIFQKPEGTSNGV